MVLLLVSTYAWPLRAQDLCSKWRTVHHRCKGAACQALVVTPTSKHSARRQYQHEVLQELVRYHSRCTCSVYLHVACGSGTAAVEHKALLLHSTC